MLKSDLLDLPVSTLAALTCCAVLILVFVYRSVKKIQGVALSPLKADDFVASTLAIGGIFLSSNVLLRVATSEDLQTCLGSEGTFAYYVGYGFSVYLAYKEVAKLFR